jgi:hypothetical protein
MPTKKAKKHAQAEKKKGHSASTQASEYVHEEMKKAQKKKISSKQAIAIGLSEARRDGVKVPEKKNKK